MSVPSSLGAITVFSVFLASLLGSVHCMGMCGGIVLSVSQSRARVVAYHLARLFGYFGLGLLLGAAGERFLGGGRQSALAWGAAVAMSSVLIVSGVRLLLGKGSVGIGLPFGVLGRPVAWLRERGFRHAGSGTGVGSAALVGLTSVLLPCAWLHGFLLAAIATQSALRGASLLGAFWLGTLPALGFAPLALKRLFRSVELSSAMVSGVLLITAGVTTVLARAVMSHAISSSTSALATPGDECPLHGGH